MYTYTGRCVVVRVYLCNPIQKETTYMSNSTLTEKKNMKNSDVVW